jgi:replicative DNA helicase
MAARLPPRASIDPRVEALRVPPHSIDAEQAVLGGLMLDPYALEKILDLLSYTDFYRRDHQLIFKAISELSEKSKPYDAVTLGDWFEAHALADQVGGWPRRRLRPRTSAPMPRSSATSRSCAA